MRPPPSGWIHAKTVEEAKNLLLTGTVHIVSLGACTECLHGKCLERSLEQWLDESNHTNMPYCDHCDTGYTLLSWMKETRNWPKTGTLFHLANITG